MSPESLLTTDSTHLWTAPPVLLVGLRDGLLDGLLDGLVGLLLLGAFLHLVHFLAPLLYEVQTLLPLLNLFTTEVGRTVHLVLV